MQSYDFLVIGGGIAGLSYALEAARAGTVAVLFKKAVEISATAGAQGGIAAVSGADDSFELHVRDTLQAGAGLCNQEIVELVVREGPERICRLIELGTEFDRKSNDEYHLHREGGHSRRRIYHKADFTGLAIQNALLDAAEANPNITLLAGANAIDLITEGKSRGQRQSHDRALGAYVLMPDGSVKRFLARKILISTGGAGKVYLYTTNPDVASGDGIAMCARAGCRIANMEFFQFHPTCLYHPQAKAFLISEALRGEGAVLRRLDGEAFMAGYHSLKELAPRDIVARAIDHEMKQNGYDHVLLDISHKPADFIREHFPTIHERCLSFGIDITVAPIPVVPAAHYLCGGVLTDSWGRSDLRDLYVAGEAACTGLHGANRLASNSLLEGVVFGYRAACHSIETLPESHLPDSVPEWDFGSATDNDEQVVISHTWDEIRRFMWNYVGIVRSNKRLERALKRSEEIEREILEYYWNFRLTPDLLELRNLSLVANLIIRSAISRHESRGLHYNIDYPRANEKCLRDTILTTAME